MSHATIDQTLRERSKNIIEGVRARFRNLVLLAAEPIDNSASAGHAAYSSMAMEIETKGLIQSTEDLLQLTRLLRELWIVGPLRKPGEGEKEAEATIASEVHDVVRLLNQLRESSRQGIVNNGAGQSDLRQGNFVLIDGGKVEAPPQTGAQ